MPDDTVKRFFSFFKLKKNLNKFGNSLSGYDSAFSLPRAHVQSLMGELKSHKPCSAGEKKKNSSPLTSHLGSDTVNWAATCSTHSNVSVASHIKIVFLTQVQWA